MPGPGTACSYTNPASQSGIQAGKRGKKKKKKNDLSPNFSMGLRIDPINMF